MLILKDENEELWPIKRVKEMHSINNNKYFRSQFPLIESYGITTHRVQGATLTKQYHIKLDATFFSTGQAYVALSRAQSLSQIHLLKYCRESIKTDDKVVCLYTFSENNGTMKGFKKHFNSIIEVKIIIFSCIKITLKNI